jgi:hypothetical protein
LVLPRHFLGGNDINQVLPKYNLELKASIYLCNYLFKDVSSLGISLSGRLFNEKLEKMRMQLYPNMKYSSAFTWRGRGKSLQI